MFKPTLILIALFASAYCVRLAKTKATTTATTTMMPLKAETLPTTTESFAKAAICPSGWFLYDSACYWYSRWEDRKAYAAAKTACSGMGSNIFVSDSKAEFNAVMRHATRAQWTWIGLTADGAHPGDAKFFKWDSNSGGNLTDLPWLNTIAPAHGHLAGSNCVAYYGGLTEDASYVHWYPCDIQPNRYYVCKHNGTATATPTTHRP